MVPICQYLCSKWIVQLLLIDQRGGLSDVKQFNHHDISQVSLITGLEYGLERWNRPYSANARTDTGGKYQLLAWAFRTAATVINMLFSSLLLGFQVTVTSEYSRLVCVGDRKLSCKRQKYIRGDKGRRLQKRSGTAEGLQAH